MIPPSEIARLAHRLGDPEAVSFRPAEKMAHRGLDPAALEEVLARKRDTFDRLWDDDMSATVIASTRLPKRLEQRISSA